MRHRSPLSGALGVLSAALACAGLLACTDVIDPEDGVIEPPIPEPRGPFPDGFLWGAAIAPYQVEGGLHDTDWFQWESRCAACSGDSADDGPAFLSNHEIDLGNAASIGNNAIRLGIDWSRLFPTEQAFRARTPDTGALTDYRAIMSAARNDGLSIMLSLTHFALPIWLHDPGNPNGPRGWEDDSIIADLADFAGWAATELGSEVDLWITLNEPMLQVRRGWIAGDMPPGKQFEITTALEVMERMIHAHARAYDAIVAADIVDADSDGVAARVAVAKHNQVLVPQDPLDPDHVRSADMLRYVLNHVFLEAVVSGNIDRDFDGDFDDDDDVVDDETLKDRLDFVGLSYFGVAAVKPAPSEANFPFIGLPLFTDLASEGVEGPLSDRGRTIYPQGLRLALEELTPYNRPIIITGNGVADSADTLRPRFLLEHLYVINEAIDDGLDIRGYFYWSLIDGFEWGAGLCPRFGLFQVDFESPDKSRTKTATAEIYRRIIEADTVLPEAFRQFPDYQTTGFCPRYNF